MPIAEFMYVHMYPVLRFLTFTFIFYFWMIQTKHSIHCHMYIINTWSKGRWNLLMDQPTILYFYIYLCVGIHIYTRRLEGWILWSSRCWICNKSWWWEIAEVLTGLCDEKVACSNSTLMVCPCSKYKSDRTHTFINMKVREASLRSLQLWKGSWMRKGCSHTFNS